MPTIFGTDPTRKEALKQGTGGAAKIYRGVGGEGSAAKRRRTPKPRNRRFDKHYSPKRLKQQEKTRYK